MFRCRMAAVAAVAAMAAAATPTGRASEALCPLCLRRPRSAAIDATIALLTLAPKPVVSGGQSAARTHSRSRAALLIQALSGPVVACSVLSARRRQRHVSRAAQKGRLMSVTICLLQKLAGGGGAKRALAHSLGRPAARRGQAGQLGSLAAAAEAEAAPQLPRVACPFDWLETAERRWKRSSWSASREKERERLTRSDVPAEWREGLSRWRDENKTNGLRLAGRKRSGRRAPSRRHRGRLSHAPFCSAQLGSAQSGASGGVEFGVETRVGVEVGPKL